MLPRFPEIPPAKQYSGEMTPEQSVTFKLVQGKTITKEEEAILQQAINFYEEAYPFLKSVDLSLITDEEAAELIAFMKAVFNMEITPQNVVRFANTYRVSFVRPDFLEKEKVRDLKYLRQPPFAVVRKNGVYGRANSPNSSVFYSAASWEFALLETKPKPGDRIILGHWTHDIKQGFVTYPIVNAKTVSTASLDKARKAFNERMGANHHLFARIIDLLMEFISSEFVKDIPVTSPRKYEYLYSGYFADQALSNSFEQVNDALEPLRHYDALIYPSIAGQYAEENLAIVPGSVKKLMPNRFFDCEVISVEPSVFYREKIPFLLKILRESYAVYDDQIIWEDD